MQTPRKGGIICTKGELARTKKKKIEIRFEMNSMLMRGLNVGRIIQIEEIRIDEGC